MKSEELSFGVTHNGKEYDIGDFLKDHPGGIDYLKPYKNKEIAKRMEEVGHSKAAYRILKEFKVSDDNEDHIDDIDDLVDLNKPILHQVSKFGQRYKEWIMIPTTKKLILSDNFIINSLVTTPWYLVLIVWVPFIVYSLIVGLKNYFKLTENTSLFMFDIPFLFLSGVGYWSFFEYLVHRFMFHFIPADGNKLLTMINCATHGFHHKTPFDPYKLASGPAGGLVSLFFKYHIFTLFIPESKFWLVAAGFFTGLTVYELIHIYCHLGNPKRGSYLHEMKRHHMFHHFKNSDDGYGVSNIFWDKIFGTVIRMKKVGI